MKKLERITGNLFESQKIPNSQASRIMGGQSTTYTSNTTGWSYPDHINEAGHEIIDFSKPFIKKD